MRTAVVAVLHAPQNYEILEELRKSSSKFLSVVLKFNVNVLGKFTKVNDVLMFFKRTDENAYLLILYFQYLEIHKYLALHMKTKQTEKSSRMKSACQCEQRQGTTCFRKQTANAARWIFHR